LKLKCVVPLSNLAVNVELRRYSMVCNYYISSGVTGLDAVDDWQGLSNHTMYPWSPRHPVLAM